jgi:probable HAF family extracellular repeat protein
MAVITLLAALAIPVRLWAQQPHYKLVDMGTFGGPASYVSGDGNGTSRVVNNGGTLTGSADTSTTDPFPAFCFNEDCFVSHTFQWHASIRTDLGALVDGVSSESSWISANGLIAGASQNGQTDPLFPGFPENHAVLWRNGHITDLGTLPEGGYESGANAVNSKGQVTGWATNTVPDPADSMIAPGFAPTQTRAFLWQAGAMQDLGTLGGTDALAQFINERGQVVGYSYTSSIPTSSCNFPLNTGSFIWDKEHGMVNLGSFGGTCTIASAINNRGQVVGESNGVGDQSSPAFIWDKGSFKPLGGSLGGDYSGAGAINDEGEAAGFAYLSNDLSNGPWHAALWKHIGSLTDLGTVGDDPCSYATSINAKTQVVGSSVSDCTLTNPSFRAFLWIDGSIYDLNTLIAPGSPLYLQLPETINDRGEIAGTGVDAGGYEHAFLLIPCPANGTADCQNEIVGATEATHASSTPAAQRPQVANPGNSIRQILRGRRGILLHIPTPIGAVSRTSSQAAPGNSSSSMGGQADFIDRGPLYYVRGLCNVNALTKKLTGYCNGSMGLHCVGKHNPTQCPPGTAAEKPQYLQMCVYGRPYVDTARGCVAFP